jgi:transposase InsO family protein
MEYPKIYCLRCKKNTENKEVKQVTTSNNRNMLKAKCADCGSDKNRFIASSKTLADELHHRVIKKFPKRKVYVHSIDQTWAVDLVDMQQYSRQNKHYKYLLAVIDVFSKYGWLIPLKNKTGVTVSEAFKTLFKERKPMYIWSDKGSEFYNKQVKELLKDNNIKLYSTENEEKSSVVERWIGTMKQKMFKYFTAQETNKYYNVLGDLVKDYNNTVHSSIKMTPVEGSKKENESTVYENLYPEKSEKNKKPKFKVGDRVRISKKKGKFEKGYTTRQILLRIK